MKTYRLFRNSIGHPEFVATYHLIKAASQEAADAQRNKPKEEKYVRINPHTWKMLG